MSANVESLLSSSVSKLLRSIEINRGACCSSRPKIFVNELRTASATNTRSWNWPRRQRGIGYETLIQLVSRANPSTILVGYGADPNPTVDLVRKLRRATIIRGNNGPRKTTSVSARCFNVFVTPNFHLHVRINMRF